MTTYTDLTRLLDGLPLVEEDHVFAPIGAGLSPEAERLMAERAALLEPRDEDAPAGEERALGEGYTARRDSLDAQIADALTAEHPEAPRVRLRGLSDADLEEIADEVGALSTEQKQLGNVAQMVERNLRLVARGFAEPVVTVEDARKLRKSLNQGEWARLLDHVSRLAYANAEQATLPNS